MNTPDLIIKLSNNYMELKANYNAVRTALSKLMVVAGTTTMNLVAFDGADELDDCIDECNKLLNRLNDHS